MTATRGPALLFASGLFWSAIGFAQPTDYGDSRLERDARKDGYVTVRVEALGDDQVVLERKRDDHFLSLVRPAGRRLQREQRLGPWAADGVERFEARTSTIPALEPEVVLALREDAPDEVVHHVLIFGREGIGFRTLFDRRFTFAKRRAPAGEVSFGDAEPRWELREVDGAPAVVWVRAPRVLSVPRANEPVTFGIGAETTEFRWLGDGFDPTGRDAYRDFLRAKPVASAEASGGDRPRAAKSARASESTPAAAGPGAPSEAVDGDLSTGWRIKKPELRGRSELTVQFADPSEVRMVRVVPGCARDAAAWRRNLEVGAFRLDLGGVLQFEIDRGRPGAAVPGVRAWAEFPLSATHGRQLLIFLDAPRRVGWARFEPLGPLDRRSKATSACVSEISFH